MKIMHKPLAFLTIANVVMYVITGMGVSLMGALSGIITLAIVWNIEGKQDESNR